MSLFGKKSNEEKKEKEPRPNNSNIVMALVCAYVIYLGVDILKKYAAGQGGGTAVWIQIGAGILFIAAGALLLVFYVRSYLRGREAENVQEQEDEKVMDEIEEDQTAGTGEGEKPTESEKTTEGEKQAENEKPLEGEKQTESEKPVEEESREKVNQ